MRAAHAALVLLALCLLPAGGADHDADPFGALGQGGTTGRFDFDQEAARPPTTLEGFLVLQTRAGPLTLNGSIVLVGAPTMVAGPEDGDADADGEDPALRQEVLARVEEHLAPHTTVRIPFSVPLRGIGSATVAFAVNHEGGGYVQVRPVVVHGVAPVHASLDAPDPGAWLASLPGRPAEVTVTLTALPGLDLTDLRLVQRALPGLDLNGFNPTQRSDHEAARTVQVGDLAPGERFTATLALPADAHGPPRSGVQRTGILPELHGRADGVAFSHPLYRSDGERLEPIHPLVYVASESTLFVLPLQEARLGVPTTLDVAALNAGTGPFHARGGFELSLPGMPHLDTVLRVDERVGAGVVGTVRLDWTPPAAGIWFVTAQHGSSGGEAHVTPLRVSGPIAEVDVLLPPTLARGTPATASVVLTASEDVQVERLRLTMDNAPVEGAISIDDLFLVEAVRGTTLEAGEPTTLRLEITPRATGTHSLLLLVETPEGPSVHHVGAHTVEGVAGGDWVALSPVLVLGALLGSRQAWRRWVP